jgi:hypothetical protein
MKGKRGPAKGAPRQPKAPREVRHTPGDIFCDACQRWHTMSSWCWIPPVLAAADRIAESKYWMPGEPLPEIIRRQLEEGKGK